MGGVIGKNDAHLTPQQKELIQKLKQQKKKLKERQKLIKICILRDQHVARNLVKRNQKKEAKELLRQKHYKAHLLHTTNIHLNDIKRNTDYVRNSDHIPDLSEYLNKFDDTIFKVDVCVSNDYHKVSDLMECYGFIHAAEDAICRELESIVAESSSHSCHHDGEHASHDNGSHHHDSGGGWDSGGGGGGCDAGDSGGGGGGDSGGGSVD